MYAVIRISDSPRLKSKNVFLRLAQYDRSNDDEFKLRIAKSIIEAKFRI